MKSKMATEQDTIMQAIAQEVDEATREVVQALAVVREDHNDRMQNVIPMISSPLYGNPH